jgi:cathepsin L
MLRRCLVFCVVFLPATLLLVWQLQGQPQQHPKIDYVEREKKASEEIKQKLAALRQQAIEKNWTFEVTYTGAADIPITSLAGTRLPPQNKVAEIAKQVNKVGAEWLAADKKMAVAFNQAHPNVLPELKIPERQDPTTHAQKSRFDWRDYKKVTPVRNQQSCGSCWDFAAIGAFECSWWIRNDEEITCSEQAILDCSKGGTCHGGWWDKVFQYLITHGVCTGSMYPYTNKDGTCKTVTSAYKAASWGFVHAGGGMPTVDEIKKALLEHGPVAVGVYASTDAFQYYKGGVFNEHVNDKGIDHAVLIVGWDDNKGKKGAWAVRNSWDTAWGEHGYIWMEYECNNIGFNAAWIEAASKHYEPMILWMADYVVKQGQTVVAPVYLSHPKDVKSLGWTLDFNTAVATLGNPQVINGNVPKSYFDANPNKKPGFIRFGLTQNEPINNDVTVAVVRFRATGAPGTKTPLYLIAEEVKDKAGNSLPIKCVHGMIEIIKEEKDLPKGSCYGRDRLGIEDVYCALAMYVENRPAEMKMDMNNDGKITPRDAEMILEIVLTQSLTGN